MDTLSRDTTPLRPVPLTAERALTELARCRRHLDAAVGSLELAVEIFSRLNGGVEGAWVRVLEDVLGRMEEVEATLRSAASETAVPVRATRPAR